MKPIQEIPPIIINEMPKELERNECKSITRIKKLIEKKKIHIGKRFGLLVIKEILPSKSSSLNSLYKFRCKCKCDCGKKDKITNLYHILSGHIKSCGCSKKNAKIDEYSKFRIFIYRILRNEMEKDIDVKYLKKLWTKQNGKCAYTNIEMTLAECNSRKTGAYNPYQASLDRIDSSKGYLKGNVEFVCVLINYAKNSFSKEQVKEFLSKIKKNE